MKIPNSVIYVFGDVLGGWYYSHSKLDTPFGGNDFPRDPPGGNCLEIVKGQLDAQVRPFKRLDIAAVSFRECFWIHNAYSTERIDPGPGRIK